MTGNVTLDYLQSAAFSSDRVYRYSLYREWDRAGGSLVVVGLNPSTADETTDDPTIRRCVGYARAWGFGSLRMLNLFAYRATDPRAMKAAADPVGPANESALRALTEDCPIVLCAWGAHGDFMGRGEAVRAMLASLGRPLFHLGLTNGGQPKHPLYLRADLVPSAWTETTHSPRAGRKEG